MLAVCTVQLHFAVLLQSAALAQSEKRPVAATLLGYSTAYLHVEKAVTKHRTCQVNKKIISHCERNVRGRNSLLKSRVE